MNVHEFLAARAADLQASVDHLPRQLPSGTPVKGGYWIDVLGQPILAPAEERAQDAESLHLVLTIHKPDFWRGPEFDPPCPGCGFDAAEEQVTQHIDDCPVLRALAWRFRHHPHWDRAWTPVEVR